MKTILVVDDDPDVTSYVKDFLIHFGYSVIARQDPASALSVIREGGTVDLVVTDYSMPGMDGVTFLTQLRTLLPGTPVVLFSGNDSIESHLRSLNLGDFDYIFKPVRAMELRSTVKAALERNAERMY